MSDLNHFNKLLKKLYNITEDSEFYNTTDQNLKIILNHTYKINNDEKKFLNTQSEKFINIDDTFEKTYTTTQGKNLNIDLLIFQKNIILLYIEKYLDEPGCEDAINNLLIHFNNKINIATNIIQNTLNKSTINSSNLQ